MREKNKICKEEQARTEQIRGYKRSKGIPVKEITGRKPGRVLQTKADEQGALGRGYVRGNAKRENRHGLIETDEKKRAGTEKARKRAWRRRRKAWRSKI